MDSILEWLEKCKESYARAYASANGAMKEFGKIRIETIDDLITTRKRQTGDKKP